MRGKTITPADSTERLTGLEIAAARLGISIWTLRKWIQDGKIASNKLGGRRLIAESEVNRLIEESRCKRARENVEKLTRVVFHGTSATSEDVSIIAAGAAP
jgi:excisionase family DNA binding protein